jgi:hypothetical protein
MEPVMYKNFVNCDSITADLVRPMLLGRWSSPIIPYTLESPRKNSGFEQLWNWLSFTTPPHRLQPLTADLREKIHAAIKKWQNLAQFPYQLEPVSQLESWQKGLRIGICGSIDQFNAQHLPPNEAGDILGYTQLNYDLTTRIHQAQICLPSDLLSADSPFLEFDATSQRAITHELGHAFGLGHFHESRPIRKLIKTTPHGALCSVMNYPQKIHSTTSLCLEPDCPSVVADEPGPLDQRAVVQAATEPKSFYQALQNKQYPFAPIASHYLLACGTGLLQGCLEQVAQRLLAYYQPNQPTWHQDVAKLIAQLGYFLALSLIKAPTPMLITAASGLTLHLLVCCLPETNNHSRLLRLLKNRNFYVGLNHFALSTAIQHTSLLSHIFLSALAIQGHNATHVVTQSTINCLFATPKPSPELPLYRRETSHQTMRAASPTVCIAPSKNNR